MENFSLRGEQVLLALEILAFDSGVPDFDQGMIRGMVTASSARVPASRFAGFYRKRVFSVQRKTLGSAAGYTRSIYNKRLEAIHEFLRANRLQISSCTFEISSLLEHIPGDHREFGVSLRDWFRNLLRAIASGEVTEEMLLEARPREEATIAS